MKISSFFSFGMSIAIVASFSSCKSSIFNVRAKKPYTYVLKYGESVILRNGYAIAPSHAPPEVHRMVAAGNNINKSPYKVGGGHKQVEDNGYDCSGAVSYILIKAGVLNVPLTSKSLKRYGRRGKGDWVTLYAKNGHVFIVVGGLRFDTSYNGEGTGPRWTVDERPTRGHIMRHPAAL